jgi:probable rRNA maturation factor
VSNKRYNVSGDKMSCLISYSVDPKTDAKNYQKLMLKIAQATFKELKVGLSFEVSVLITTNQMIKKLNSKYRKLNKPTDVLSFPSYSKTELKKLKESKQILNLGDIVISHQLAKQQALEYGHSLKREVSFLFVHGLLHLLGYDHMNKTDEKQMFKLQDKILNSLGIRR